MYRKDLHIGDKFGEWMVIEILTERKHGYIQYRVRCSCGKEAIHTGSYLINEKSLYCRSCSTKKRMLKGEESRLYKHGMTFKDHPLEKTYRSWVMMRQRCNNPKSRDYKNYGKRGIKVCEEWNTFDNFLKDMGPKPENMSLERINNQGNYEKFNCKWASKKEQNNNKRTNTFFIIDGQKVTRTQIQEKLEWTRDMYRRRFEKYGEEWIKEEYQKNKPNPKLAV